MFLYILVILFLVIVSTDREFHKQCVCKKWVRLLQCTHLNPPTEYSTFTVDMLWVESTAFISSTLDTDTNLLVTHIPNLKEIKLYNCNIASCNLNSCPELNTSAVKSVNLLIKN